MSEPALLLAEFVVIRSDKGSHCEPFVFVVPPKGKICFFPVLELVLIDPLRVVIGQYSAVPSNSPTRLTKFISRRALETSVSRLKPPF